MRRGLIAVAALLAAATACHEPTIPPPPPTAGDLLVGTWELDPPDAERLAAWKATIGGAAPKGDDEVDRWLATHRDHPDARRIVDALAAADAVRLDVSAEAMTVRRADRTDRVAWTWWGEAEDELGHRTMRVRTTTPDGVERELDVRFRDDDHVVLIPTTAQEPAGFRRVR